MQRGNLMRARHQMRMVVIKSARLTVVYASKLIASTNRHGMELMITTPIFVVVVLLVYQTLRVMFPTYASR